MSWLTDLDDEDDEYGRYEDSVRVRPNRRGSRPRTKQRPAHEEAVEGRVLGVDRGRYAVLLDEGGPDERTVTTARARELGRKSVVPGDRVDVVGDTTGADGSLGRIVRVQERRTLLRRSADDSDAVERVIVANADQMLIVVAAADPEPRPRLVDRYLVAAFDADIDPILVITKADRGDARAFAEHFSCLDLPVLVSRPDAVPLDELRALLVDRLTVAVGHSGVGKSTLVNALVPGADRATGAVNTVTGRGRHTSSSSIALRVGDGVRSGWIVDTPGVRSFGLGHVQPENILRSFADRAVPVRPAPEGAVPFRLAPDDEIIERVEAGELGDNGRERLAALRRLISGGEDETEVD